MLRQYGLGYYYAVLNVFDNGHLEITSNGMCEDDPLAEFSIDPVDLMQRSQVKYQFDDNTL